MRNKRRFLIIILLILLSYQSIFSDPLMIQAGAEYGYPPYCIIDGKGEADGFSVELLTAALEVMGYDVEFSIDTWQNIVTALSQGDIQVLPLMSRNPDREETFDFTFPYITMNGTYVVHEEGKMPADVEDLVGLRVGVMEGDSAASYIESLDIEMTILTAPTSEEVLRMLDAQEIDVCIMQRYSAFELIEELGLENLIVSNTIIGDLAMHFCFAVKEGDSKLLSILNEGLATIISNGTFVTLQAEWFSHTNTSRRRYNRIVVGGDDNYPPFEFIDNDGEPSGFNVDLTKAIAEEMGLDIEIRLGPWNEIYGELLDEEIDILQGVLYSPDREKELSFSQAHTAIEYVAVNREGGKEIRSLEDLSDQMIIVQEQDIMHEILIDAGFEHQLILVPSQTEAMIQLQHGNGDCAVISRLSAYYTIEHLGLEGLSIGKKTLANPQYNYGSLDSFENRLYPFSEGLAVLKASGEYRDIYTKWFGAYTSEKGLSQDQIIRILIFIAIPLLLIICLVYLWIRMLKRQVRLRTNALAVTTTELESHVQELTKIRRRLSEREQRFSYAVEGTRDGLWDHDLITDYCYHSDQYARMLGYDPQDLNRTTHTWLGLLHPNDKERAVSTLERYIKDHVQIYETSYRLRNREGSYRWISTRGRIIYDEKGKALRIVGFNTDITDKVRAETEKEAQEIKFHKLFNTLADPICILSPSGTILEMNYAVESVFGYAEDELLNKPIESVFPDIRELDIKKILHILISDNSYLLTHEVARKEGEKFLCEINMSLSSFKGKKAILAIIRDVHERNRLEELQQRNDKLNSLGILAGGIAHDFNNLLSSLFGYLELAQMASSPQDGIHEYLDKAIQSFERTKNLTMQLLTFSKGGTPKLKSDTVYATIQESAEFALSGSKIGIDFIFPMEHWLVDFDRNQISQVIDNLVINGKQAMPDGGKLSIEVENMMVEKISSIDLPRGDYVSIKVTDTGIGISSRIVDKIFDPYFSTKKAGSGLGLATCYSIIQKHNGMITVESHIDEGTTFSIFLPRSNKVLDSDIPSKGEVMEQFEGVILVMDDEKAILDITSKMLEMMGFSVLTASHGEEALTVLADHPEISLGLFDLTIPGGLGARDIIEQVLEIHPELPVIATSGYSDDQIMSNPAQFGFAASQAKPYKMAELMNAIKSVL